MNGEQEHETNRTIAHGNYLDSDDEVEEFKRFCAGLWRWLRTQNIPVNQWIQALASVALIAVTAFISCSGSKQTQALIDNGNRQAAAAERFADAANEMKQAAWDFKGSAQGIDGNLGNAVSKLDAQNRSTDLARVSAQRSSEQQMSVLQEQMEMSERPLVGVAKYAFFDENASPNESARTSILTVGKPIEINIDYLNEGKSPALNLQVFRHVSFGLEALSDVIADTPKDARGSDLFPKTDPDLVTAITLRDSSKSGEFNVSISDTRGWTGKFPIITWGEIIYYDRFNNKYCTPFLEVKYPDPSGWAVPGLFGVNGKEKTISELCPKDSVR